MRGWSVGRVVALMGVAMCVGAGSGWAQSVPAGAAASDSPRPGARPGGSAAEVVTFAGGVITGIGTGTLRARQIAALPEGEGVLRAHAGRLYVLTPESGRVRALDRSGAIVGEALVDPALGPVDIAPVGDDGVWVTTAVDGRVTRVTLGDGFAARSFVDLRELDEPDEAPDPGMMIVDGGRLFVQLRRLDDENPGVFDERGALAVIDLASETLIDADAAAPGVQAIELAGPHPRLKMRILDDERRLYVSSSGADAYTLWPLGGMDEVDLDSLAALGLVFSEFDAANISAIWPTSPTTGFLIFHTDIIASAHLASYAAAPFMVDGIHDELFGYVEVMAYDERTGRIFMPTLAGQVRVFDAASEQTLAVPAIGGGVATDIELVRWR